MKVNQELLVKHYRDYEDALFDVNYSFLMIEFEGTIYPNENIIYLEDDEIEIYKLKTMVRQTLFGPHHENVYILN
jgi:hypothetical protein